MGYFTLFKEAPKIHGDNRGFWANKELVFLEPSTPLSSLGGNPNDQLVEEPQFFLEHKI